MKKAYQKTVEEICHELNTSFNGLTNIEAKNRIKKYGQNILTKVVKLNFTNTKRVKALLKEQ